MYTRYVGDNIRRIRRYRGFTQTQLAEEIHISRSMMSRIENGKCIPQYNVMQTICNTLKTDLETLENKLPDVIGSGSSC